MSLFDYEQSLRIHTFEYTFEALIMAKKKNTIINYSFVLPFNNSKRAAFLAEQIKEYY